MEGNSNVVDKRRKNGGVRGQAIKRKKFLVSAVMRSVEDKYSTDHTGFIGRVYIM